MFLECVARRQLISSTIGPDFLLDHALIGRCSIMYLRVGGSRCRYVIETSSSHSQFVAYKIAPALPNKDLL